MPTPTVSSRLGSSPRRARITPPTARMVVLTFSGDWVSTLRSEYMALSLGVGDRGGLGTAPGDGHRDLHADVGGVVDHDVGVEALAGEGHLAVVDDVHAPGPGPEDVATLTPGVLPLLDVIELGVEPREEHGSEDEHGDDDDPRRDHHAPRWTVG